MLVTCPECSHKISSESEECKKCGLPDAAKRSKEYWENIFESITQVVVDHQVNRHSKEHEVRTVISEVETHVQYGMNEDDVMKFHPKAAKGSRGRYYEILDLNISRCAEYAGYQLNCSLKCMLCGKIVQAVVSASDSLPQHTLYVDY